MTTILPTPVRGRGFWRIIGSTPAEGDEIKKGPHGRRHQRKTPVRPSEAEDGRPGITEWKPKICELSLVCCFLAPTPTNGSDEGFWGPDSFQVKSVSETRFPRPAGRTDAWPAG